MQSSSVVDTNSEQTTLVSRQEVDQVGSETSNTHDGPNLEGRMVEEMMRKYVVDNLSDEDKSCEDFILDLGKKRISI